MFVLIWKRFITDATIDFCLSGWVYLELSEGKRKNNNDNSNPSVVLSIPDRLQIAGGNNVAGNGAPVNYNSDPRAQPWLQDGRSCHGTQQQKPD